MDRTITISNRLLRGLPCVQSAGHIRGCPTLRAVRYRGHVWIAVDDTSRPVLVRAIKTADGIYT